jgi:hypothetical protein
MHAAFPRPEYYDGSAPPAPSAGVTPIPAPPFRPKGARGTNTDGSHVHCCPVSGLGTRLCPCGTATATPQSFTVASRPGLMKPSLEFPAMAWRARTANQPGSTGLELAGDSRGLTTPVPHVYLPVMLTAPAPSGSAGTTRLCRGCSRPPRRPADQAASSFTPPLRRQRDEGLPPPSETDSASWRTTKISASFGPWLRPSRTSQPDTRIMIKYSRRKDTNRDHA